jgi:hypothetical protein
MTISVSDVIVVAPELSTVDPAIISQFITYSADYVSSSIFGNKLDFAHVNLTAHFLTMRGRGGPGGQVTSEKVGDLSRSYGQLDTSADALQQTSYGQAYMFARESNVMTPMVIY